MLFLFIFLFTFVVGITFYKKQRPQWKNATLFPDEKVLYTQLKTTIYTTGSDGVRRGMAWAAIKITNKRIVFLYPDKKAISKVLDFSGEKQKSQDEKLQRNTLYIDRVSMVIEKDVKGHETFVGKAVNSSGDIVVYRFLLHEGATVKNILGI